MMQSFRRGTDALVDADLAGLLKPPTWPSLDVDPGVIDGREGKNSRSGVRQRRQHTKRGIRARAGCR